MNLEIVLVWWHMRLSSSPVRMTVAKVLLLALAPVGVCQTTIESETEPENSETIEEITVYGKKSLTRLRHEIYDAEEDFFLLFSELNSNDLLDVDCDFVSVLGDRRKHHVCVPSFAKKAEAEAVSAVIISGRIGAGLPQVDSSWAEYAPDAAMVKNMDELLRLEVWNLLAESSALREAFTKLIRAKEVYASERERRRN